ncbi:hypothetical protein [Rhodopila sp.]|jgi:hypothetical protein|uniref:hypothetical protein n=1 Tax=Rhodopila sp. TaxID=2480087 RepID=UPI002C5F4EF8|nr:hypothetical protein [Rhodopila sp.]HVZ10303.1 hypothetical protein [Rhodopila sp.]
MKYCFPVMIAALLLNGFPALAQQDSGPNAPAVGKTHTELEPTPPKPPATRKRDPSTPVDPGNRTATKKSQDLNDPKTSLWDTK